VATGAISPTSTGVVETKADWWDFLRENKKLYTVGTEVAPLTD
jgi:hypothetical protein